MSPERTWKFQHIGRTAADGCEVFFWQVSARRTRDGFKAARFARQEYYVVRSAFEKRLIEIRRSIGAER